MCLSPVSVKRVNPITHSTHYDVVPCGKCMECLKSKQSGYAFVSERQARHSGNMVFLTLTYTNDTIPFAGVFETYHRETGACIDRSQPFRIREEYADQVRREYFDSAPRFRHKDGSFGPECGWQLEIPTSYVEDPEIVQQYEKVWTYDESQSTIFTVDPKNVYSQRYGTDESKFDVRAYATPSLCREDVKQWFKKSRILFKRKYGYSPKFKYLLIGEYGKSGKRPHYHALLFGVDKLTYEYLANRWRSEFGSCDVEPVRPRGNDSLSAAQEKVSRYIAKYMSKGVFEEEFVKCGYVQKPRRQSSLNIGTETLEDLRSYILAFDIYGVYDPDSPPPEVLKDSSLDILLSRRYLVVNKDNGRYLVRIPKLIYDKCLSKFYGKDKATRKSMGFCRSPETPAPLRISHQRSFLHRKLASRQKEIIDRSYQQHVSLAKNGESFGPSSLRFRMAFDSLSNLEKSSRRQAAQAYWSQLRSFYQNSI